MARRNKVAPPARARCAAVIVAAGGSTRMGEDKLLLELDGIPVLARTMAIFQSSPVIDEIVVVTQKEKILTVAQFARDYFVTKLTRVVPGGKTRTESAYAGVTECGGDIRLIAIQDGARPLVTGEVIERAVAAADLYGAAAPAVKVKDTVRQARNGMVLKTLEREELYFMQTPQVFKAELIRESLKDACEIGLSLTDDCQAVMLKDAQVRLVEGDYENLKLTTPEDVHTAEMILEARRERW